MPSCYEGSQYGGRMVSPNSQKKTGVMKLKGADREGGKKGVIKKVPV